MLLSSFLLVLGLVLAKFSSGSPSTTSEDHSIDPGQLLSLRRRADSGSNESVAVTGISIGGFAPRARLEIRQLEKDTAAWNIYLLGSVTWILAAQYYHAGCPRDSTVTSCLCLWLMALQTEKVSGGEPDRQTVILPDCWYIPIGLAPQRHC